MPVYLEHVGAPHRAGEDAGVGVQAAAHVAVGTVECEVLLAAAVVGLVPAVQRCTIATFTLTIYL